MKYLAIGMAALFAMTVGLLSVPAYADEGAVPNGLINTLSSAQVQQMRTRGAGNVMSTATSATFDEFDFGFQSQYVTVCYRGGGTANTVAYLQLTPHGDFLGTSAIFIAGDASNPAAVTMTGGGDGTDKSCMTHPWKIRGLTFHTVANGDSTLEVNAF